MTMTSNWKKVTANQATAANLTAVKTEMALQNVENTSDANKPLSTAANTALNAKVDKTTTVNGEALSANITLTTDNISDAVSTNKYTTSAEKSKLANITVTSATDLDDIRTKVASLDQALVLKGDWDASTGSFAGAGAAQAGWTYLVSVSGTVDSIDFNVGDRLIAITDNASTTTYANNWFKDDGTDKVSSVNGKVGSVTVTSSDVGLGNVDNTSDASKPVSTAQQTEINNKSLTNARELKTTIDSPVTLEWGKSYVFDASSGDISATIPTVSGNEGNKISAILKDTGITNSNKVTFTTADVAGTIDYGASGADTLDVIGEKAIFQASIDTNVERL